MTGFMERGEPNLARDMLEVYRRGCIFPRFLFSPQLPFNPSFLVPVRSTVPSLINATGRTSVSQAPEPK